MNLSSLLNPQTEDEQWGASDRSEDHPPTPGGSGDPPPSGRKYPCKVCYRVFTTSGHLSRHMKVHTGERKYVCPYPGCDVRCNRSDNLVQHYRVHLPKEERKLGNAHIRDSLKRMNSYASSSSSTGQVSPGTTEPTEYIGSSSTSLSHLPSGSGSHYSNAPVQYTTSHSHYPSVHPPTQYTSHSPQQQPLISTTSPLQSPSEEEPPPSFDDDDPSTGSGGEDNDEDEDDDEEDPGPSSRSPGFPVSESRYEAFPD